MEYQRLLMLIEIRYGKIFIEELKEACQLTDNDFDNVKIIFEYTISKVSKYYQLKLSTLNALKIINPHTNEVRDDVEIISETDLITINSELNTMKQILETLR